MTTADKLTTSRIVLAPVFFAVFMLDRAGLLPSAPAVVALWALFAVIELSDLLDGMAARSTSTVSDFGKLFDPFADVLARLTYFVCFSIAGIMPVWVLLLVLYREYGIMFVRMLLAGKGVAMGARPGGKAKAVVYMLAGAFSLLVLSARAFAAAPDWLPRVSQVLAWAVYGLAAALSVASFVDYMVQFRKLYKA